MTEGACGDDKVVLPSLSSELEKIELPAEILSQIKKLRPNVSADWLAKVRKKLNKPEPAKAKAN